MSDGVGDASGKMKKAAKKLFAQSWGSLCRRDQQNMVVDSSTAISHVFHDCPKYSAEIENQERNISCGNISSEITELGVPNSSPPSDKNLCAICLDPLNYSSGGIFTAQCSHAFHFACISSNVSHGSVTCPICRAHWTQLPRDQNIRCSLHKRRDPALQILDESISSLRVHRDALLHTVRYGEDDPIVSECASDQFRLHLSLHPSFNTCSYQGSEFVPWPQSEISSSEHHGPSGTFVCTPSNRAYLRVKLSHRPASDVVLVAIPYGPDLRLMKQAMALTILSLRHTDRLAIITHSSGMAGAFPLRRMTPHGKRTALQLIDHVFYAGQADTAEVLTKGVKILTDRLHKNPSSIIIHLTDTPSTSHNKFDNEAPNPIHRFHIRYRFNTHNTFFMHEFEEFLAGTLGGRVEDVQLRIGGGGMMVSIGELRGGEERNIPVCVGICRRVRVAYSYREGECSRRGEVIVGIVGEKRETNDGSDEEVVRGRRGSGGIGNWGCHEPSRAARRRWAMHLQHG